MRRGLTWRRKADRLRLKRWQIEHQNMPGWSGSRAMRERVWCAYHPRTSFIHPPRGPPSPAPRPNKLCRRCSDEHCRWHVPRAEIGRAHISHALVETALTAGAYGMGICEYPMWSGPGLTGELDPLQRHSRLGGAGERWSDDVRAAAGPLTCHNSVTPSSEGNRLEF